jgi:hypothetical protein
VNDPEERERSNKDDPGIPAAAVADTDRFEQKQSAQ